jgi:acyl-CoA thioesterase FadM
MTSTVALPALLAAPTTVQVRPRYEGSNICTWIGFKHVNYLVEEAVLDHFRQVGTPARALYEDHGLCVEFVELDTRITSAFHMDDLVTADVMPATRPDASELAFSVSLTVQQDSKPVKAAGSKVRVLLRVDQRGGPVEDVPAELRPFSAKSINRPNPSAQPLPILTPLALGRDGAGGDPVLVLAELTRGTNSFAWRWRIPYPYCHFTERMQMSGYLRQMEEVVDLFLADRGVSIRTLLDEQDRIPVVPRSTITFLDEALMEEELYTVFTVEDVFKGVTYTARMDCYVVRDGALVQTATGRITHGYAVIQNRRDWSLVDFDERMLAALAGRLRQPVRPQSMRR